ncbi:MAG: biotin--[Clostridia bacterium]|nr:biotin--[acetyl-CoA-carboxylase] ligase [Clostridia bacterium]
MNDILSAEGVKKHLKNPQSNIFVLDCVDSTNSYMKTAEFADKPEGTTVIAGRQTCGRGRFNRTFHSPENSGIYMSILLRPRIPAADAVLITALAAVAVSEAIEALSSARAEIKWVNDVLIKGKKVCGILPEATLNLQNGRLERVILGIGINVYTPKDGFADEIKDIAGAVFERSDENLRNRFAAEIINRFFEQYPQIAERSFLDYYISRSCVIGKNVTVISGESRRRAAALGIDSDCHLLVELEDGSQELLSSGEVSLKLS